MYFRSFKAIRAHSISVISRVAVGRRSHILVGVVNDTALVLEMQVLELSSNQLGAAVAMPRDVDSLR